MVRLTLLVVWALLWAIGTAPARAEEAAGPAATERAPASQPAGTPDAATAVQRARAFLAAAKEKATRLQAFAVPPPADDWWLVEYQLEGGLAVSPGPAVYVHRKTGEVTRKVPQGMPPRM